MRKMIAAAAVLAVTSAHAAEELKFGDVNYFFKAGQINVAADINSSYSKQTLLGVTTEDRGYILKTAYTYAFTDRFNAFIGLDYAFNLETENKTTPAALDSHNSGLANPSIGANFRLLNQNTSPFNLDFGAIAKFGVEDAEKGYNGKDGNYASGRDSLEINARIGNKWDEANEWQLAVGGVYYNDGESEVSTTTGTSDVDEDSSYDVYARATYQYRPVNEFMMLISAQVNQVGEAESKIKDGDSYEHDSHIDVDLRFTAKYLITDNFIAKFNYGMSRNSEYDINISGQDQELKKRRENFFGLGVDFLF
jgi:outer membrane protein W